MIVAILLIFDNWKKCRLGFVFPISKMTKYQYNDLETKEENKRGEQKEMPTVKSIPGPYRLFFYSFDCNEPMHVHSSMQILVKSSCFEQEQWIFSKELEFN